MLTVIKLGALKPAAKLYRVADAGGLCIEVTPSGSKLWRYRYRFAGKVLDSGPPKVATKHTFSCCIRTGMHHTEDCAMTVRHRHVKPVFRMSIRGSFCVKDLTQDLHRYYQSRAVYYEGHNRLCADGVIVCMHDWESSLIKNAWAR